MPNLLVLVNGLPGAGKTTLAEQLAPVLDAVLISKDAIKEAVADAVRLKAQDADRLGAAAMEMAWSLAGGVRGAVIIESWWFGPRDAGFVRAGIARVDADRTVELWCAPPVEVARARYRDRRRHPIHADAIRLIHDWEHWAAHAAPLGLTPSVMVDTSGPVDLEVLTAEIRAEAQPIARNRTPGAD